MATRTQNPGTTLKNQISTTDLLPQIPLEEIFCEKDRENNLRNVPAHKHPALQAVAAYKRRQDEIAYGGTLSEMVYDFMDGRMWVDRNYNYRHAAVSVLTALADLKFNKELEEKIGRCAKEDLVDLLSKTLQFMRDLNMSCFRPLLLMQEIVNCDMTQDDLDEITNEYQARLEMSLSGRYKRA